MQIQEVYYNYWVGERRLSVSEYKRKMEQAFKYHDNQGDCPPIFLIHNGTKHCTRGNGLHGGGCTKCNSSDSKLWTIRRK